MRFCLWIFQIIRRSLTDTTLVGDDRHPLPTYESSLWKQFFCQQFAFSSIGKMLWVGTRNGVTSAVELSRAIIIIYFIELNPITFSCLFKNQNASVKHQQLTDDDIICPRQFCSTPNTITTTTIVLIHSTLSMREKSKS